MKKIDIKGKDYVPVNERIIYFRTEEEFKGWGYLTEIISHDNGIVVMCTTVYNEDGVAKSNGFAYEKDGSSFINKTSYIENCETSSVGRALGNLGIGIDTSVASFEEVANAITQQNTPPKKQQSAPKHETKSLGNVTEEEAFKLAVQKGMESIEKTLVKVENFPYRDIVIQNVCDIYGWKTWQDATFKDNNGYKKLLEIVNQELQKEKDLAQAGV